MQVKRKLTLLSLTLLSQNMKLISIIVCFLTLPAAAQQYTASVVKKKPLRVDTFIGVDKYDALYYIRDDVFYKQTAESEYRFNDFQLGSVSGVDIINPLRITVFYARANTAVIVDNRLNEVRRLPLATTPPFINAANATTAADNSLWVFNEDSQQLERFSYRSHTSRAISLPVPELYITHAGNFYHCYVLTEKNLRLYNIYGSHLRSIPNEGISHLTVSDGRIAVLQNGELWLYDKELTESHPVSLPEGITVKNGYLKGNILYIYDGEILYELNL